MDLEGFVERWFDGWNRRNVQAMLDMLHPGAAYYDAFWMEICFGNDFAQYLQDTLNDEPHWFVLAGDVIPTDSGAVYRYSAHEHCDSGPGALIYHGAEVLVLRDDKILTVSDFYCNPDRDALEEIANVVSNRHGVPNHTISGLGAQRSLQIKKSLMHLLEDDTSILDPQMTPERLADGVGCSAEQLAFVVRRRFGMSLECFVDSQKISHAAKLIDDGPDDDEILKRAAVAAGFLDYDAFCNKFEEARGVSPETYRRDRKRQRRANGSHSAGEVPDA